MRLCNDAGMKRIHAFKAGTHIASDGTKHTITQADIAEIASSFADGNGGHDAPLVVGHPELNAPAYGWVQSCEAEGGDLYVVPRDVEAAFSEAVNAKRYPKVSVSVWPRDHARNPVPGKLVLRHVGFLGSMPPSVKGLQEASFADSEGCLDFAYQESWGWRGIASVMRNLREWLIGKEGVDVADGIIPNYQIDDARVAAEVVADESAAVIDAQLSPPSPAMSYSEVDFAARERALAEREIAILAREQAQALSVAAAAAAIEANAATKATHDYADGLVKSGHVLPRERDAVVELVMRVGGGSLDFAEGATPAVDLLKAFLEARPVIDFSEKSGASENLVRPMEFAASSGSAVDSERLTVWAAAKAHQEANGTTFDDALSAVLPK